MANFHEAFNDLIKNEGGYTLTNISGDTGGETFAGISRVYHPDWGGWEDIDKGEVPIIKVQDFYKRKFWEPIWGTKINDQSIANTLFDFSVNAGKHTAIRLAQTIVGTKPDGWFGPNTLVAINSQHVESFLQKYMIAKVRRYAEICNRDKSQKKFLLGWINRALRGV